MLCPLVPAQMHREGEDAMTLGTRERVRPMPASLEDLALRLGDSAHAPDRRASIGRLRQKDRESAVEEQRPLTDAQKASIAEARNVYQAKVAEREILHQDALVKAKSHEEIEKLNEEMRRDLERLAGERDRKIDEIRKRG